MLDLLVATDRTSSSCILLIDANLVIQFVQMLANPHYLNHLATQKLLDNEEFIAYLDYLQYFRQPKYLRYLQ